MTTQPLVSIISVNFNQAAVTCELLHTLSKLTYPSIEIIVIDNGSDEDPIAIEKQYPNVQLIRTGKNLGFAGGNNVGLKVAKGDYFLLLNNDTEVPSNFLEPLVARMQSDERIGAVSPKILFYHQPNTIQFAGFTAINPYTGRGFAIGSKQIDDGRYDVAMPTNRAHGAAMMLSRKVVQKIGLMIDTYFLYYEEMDYCERIKRAGYTIWYESQSKVYHKESVSTGKNSPFKTYYLTRNRLLFMRLNTNTVQFAISLAYLLGIAMPKNILSFILKTEWKHVNAYIKGLFWHLKHLNLKIQSETL